MRRLANEFNRWELGAIALSCVLAPPHLLLQRHVLLAVHVALLVGLKLTHALIDLYIYTCIYIHVWANDRSK
jgi:hypothetical protein